MINAILNNANYHVISVVILPLCVDEKDLQNDKYETRKNQSQVLQHNRRSMPTFHR